MYYSFYYYYLLLLKTDKKKFTFLIFKTYVHKYINT